MLAGCAAGPDYVRPRGRDAARLEGRGALARRHARRRRAEGPVVAALRRSAPRRAAGAGARRTARRSRSPARASRRRGPRSRPPRPAVPERRASARAARASASRPTGRSATTPRPTSRPCRTTSSPRSSVSYELDLAGRVQRTVEGAAGQRRAVGRRLREHPPRCSAPTSRPRTSTCARLDIELDVLARSIALQRRSLDFVTTRHDLGAASGLDVAQQQALLDTTLTQLDVLRRQRGPFEHAIATLTGTPAPSFSLAADIRELTPPRGAARRPFRRPRAPARRRLRRARDGRGQRPDRRRQGRLLPEHHDQRRPSATRAASLANLFNAPSLLWSFGASADAAALRRRPRSTPTSTSRAPATTPTVASYRRVVLNAMQEVEDGITGLAALERADRRRRASPSRRAQPRARPRDRALRRRRDDVPRRHHRPAVAAQQPSGWRPSSRGSACSPRCS